jgi:hypothetical protein
VTARRFTVSLDHAHHLYGGPRRYFRVAIYDDREAFQAAALQYNGVELEAECHGVCQPAPVKEDGSDPSHFGGVIRFVASHLTPEVAAHEMVHAALVVYRMDINPDVRLGNGCRLREEHLAHIAGDLISQLDSVLRAATAYA